MSVFSITISYKIEDIHCYYLCENTHKIFKDKKGKIHDLMIVKNIRSNEMIILCKNCYGFLQKNFTPNTDDFFVTLKNVRDDITQRI